MIQSHGSAQPQAFFIADSAVGEDLRTNYALTGYNGSLLNGFCRDNGINLDNQWRACLIKDALPPEKNPFALQYDSEIVTNLLTQYSPYLVNEIQSLKPNLLIPLGPLSFKFLTGLDNFRKFRGSILPLNANFQPAHQTKVLPILGPSILNKEYRMRVITRLDFTKIGPNLHQGPPPDDLYNIWVARTASQLRTFLERHFEKTLADPNGYLVFDIETYLQIPICLSLCFDGFESVTIPLIDPSIDLDNRALMAQMVAKVLNSRLPKVNQNIKYDYRILERWGFRVNNIAGDTMLAASTLYCEFPKNLGFLTSIYTNLPYFKDEGKEFDPDRGKRDRYYLYNAKDSLATYQIYRKQLGEVGEQGTSYVYENLIKCLPLYKRMEDRGIRIDRERQLNLLCKYESMFHIEELKCCQLLNRQVFNPLSPLQCRKVVYDELGYKKVKGVKTTESGEPSTDEESLDALSVYGEAARAPTYGAYVLSSIIAARKFHKVIEILELYLHPDERFRCEFNLAGTETGRSSAGETTDQLIWLDKGKIKLRNLGHSLQTIGKHGFMVDGRTYGKDLRSMFVPSSGYIFVECDLSGAEARVDRVLSANYDMSVFSEPGIHRLTGSWVYDCTPSEIKKNILVDGVDRYHMAKTVRHAGERNISEHGLAIMTNRPVSECKLLLRTFHEREPAIRQVFHKEISTILYSGAPTLIAPNGRRRDFFDRISGGTVNEAISQLPQAIVSDQTKFCGIVPTFSSEIAAYSHLLAEQHDGILSEVKIGREEQFYLTYKKNVEQPINFKRCTLSRDYELTIPCEVSVGENWWEMEEVKV